MLTLIDIAAPLYPYAHNATVAQFGGYYNDIDMLVMGDGPDFVCGDVTSPRNLSQCISHFSLWCVMKAPLLLGTNLTALDATTLSLVTNADAIAINQDPLGIQGRRYAIQTPRNNTIGPTQADNIIVAAHCDAADPTQTWHVEPSGTPGQIYLGQAPCAAAPAQSFTLSGAGALSSPAFPGVCMTASPVSAPWWRAPILEACNASDPAQAWTWHSPSGQIVAAQLPSPLCLAINYPNAGDYAALVPCVAGDEKQIWTAGAAPGSLTSAAYTANCLVAAQNYAAGTLSTVDAQGQKWCVNWQGWPASSTIACDGPYPVNAGDGVDWYFWAQPGNDFFFLAGTQRSEPWQSVAGGPQPDTGNSSSGPLPHVRYAYSNGGGWNASYEALAAPAGAAIAWPWPLWDDDMRGNVSLTSGWYGRAHDGRPRGLGRTAPRRALGDRALQPLPRRRRHHAPLGGPRLCAQPGLCAARRVGAEGRGRLHGLVRGDHGRACDHAPHPHAAVRGRGR